MKFPNFTISTLVSISCICLAAKEAQARTFIDPSLGDKFIAGCLGSFRFQDSCNQAARNLIAEKFCQYQGEKTFSQYQVEDRGWKRRMKMWAWKEFYDNGQLKTGFYEDVSSFRFTVIECRK
ncbi:MAG: hypothetical protein AB1861_27195 [Cyanobacteriota bacterium]